MNLRHALKSGACCLILLSACSQSPPPPLASSPLPSPSPSPQPTLVPTTKAQAVKAFEQRLQADIAQKAGINVGTITCPTQVTVGTKQTFNCQATAEGKTFTVVVNPEDNKNGLQWSTKGLLVLPKLEQTIRQGIRTQFQIDVKTSCGGKVRVAKPGDRFQCKITDDRGQSKAVTVQVDDDKGNVTWKL